MRPERLTQIADALRDAGVPDQVVKYAIGLGLSSWIYVAGELFYFAVMVAGFAVGGFYLWPYLDEMAAGIARSHAIETNALLYSYDFGLSLVIGLFGWIFSAATLTLAGLSVSPRLRASTFAFAVVDGLRRRSTRWMIRRSIARSLSETDPVRYIRRTISGWMLAIAAPAALLATVSAIAIPRDVRSHTIYGATAYVNSPFLPWGTSARDWASAVSVETGCNHVERNGKISDDIIYKVRFADGASTRIGSATPIQGTWLSAAERIDEQLRAAGATFSPWKWLGRDPIHPLCIAALRDRFPGRDFERLRRLLRLP